MRDRCPEQQGDESITEDRFVPWYLMRLCEVDWLFLGAWICPNCSARQSCPIAVIASQLAEGIHW